MKHLATLLAVSVLGACAPTAPPAATPDPTTPVVVGPGPDYPTMPPPPGPAPALRLPVPRERILANGLRVIYVPKTELPAVQAVLVTRGGREDDPAHTPGLAAFAAEMLDEGAGGKSALELAEAIEQLGASLSTHAGWDGAQVDLGVLRGRLPEALQLMADVVYRPDFPEREVRRVRDERLTELNRARDEARIIAGNAFASLLYGSAHPYGRQASTESTRGIERRALVDFHRQFYRPASSTLILVGDVDESLNSAVERAFGAWRGSVVATAAPPQVPTASVTRIYLIDNPGALQSEIRIGHPAVARDNPDYYAVQVLNTLLGGFFSSRLSQNLREARAYTYNARSSFAMRRGAGPFTAFSAVMTAKTDSAVIEFFRELNRVRDEPVPADELDRAKRYVTLGLPREFEGTEQIASRIAELVIYGLPLNYYDTFVERIMAVTPEDVQRVARQYVRPQHSAVVVVGDRATIEQGLRALPMGALEVRRADEFVR
jgi:zinc protease